jgi:hypothetical protein
MLENFKVTVMDEELVRSSLVCGKHSDSYALTENVAVRGGQDRPN